MSDVKKLLQSAYKAVKTDEGYGILGSYGWLDGGCWELARAVKDVYPGAELIAVTRKGKKQVEHVAAKWGPFIVDGSGVKSQSEFRKYWEHDEVDGLGSIDIVPLNLANVVPGSPPLDPHKVKKIRDLITRPIALATRTVVQRRLAHVRSKRGNTAVSLKGIR